jgi:penicillin-binding protein 1A
MENPFEQRKTRKGPKATRLLDIDAWIDSTLYEGGFKAGEIWENLTIFFRRFRVTGWRRAIIELLSEGATIGAGGSVVMLALALPAFDETSTDWRNQGDFAVTFLDRYGNEIGQRGIIQRDSVPVDEMPDHVVNAVLATEDRRFYEHFGIDFLGLFRAMSENVRANSVVQGGSTITQQLAKNLFLSNERTVERKVKEAFLSLWLETNLSKKEILQLYLDRAYMGGGTFGIAAAADFYFGKDVKDLTLAEAAMLAGLFKAPAKYAPHINLPAARARANEVLTNMVQGGFLTEGQVLSARLHPADVVDRGDRKTPDYFLDYAFDEAKRVAGKYGIHSMVARTTIDLNLQQAAEEALEFHLRQYGKDYGVTEGAIVMLENNGAVRAIVGGRDYGASQFNRATKALRQAGSSFKVYTYTAAMEKGLTPETAISDGPISWGNWSPKNYGRGYAGRVTLLTAITKSINTVPVRLAKDYLSIPVIKAEAIAMGVESTLEDHKTMVLGTSGMTVMDQATGYNTLADGGFAGTRHAITQLMTRSGEVFFDFERDGPKPKRVVSEKAMSEMNSMLVQVPEIGTARRAALRGIRSAGKTGTTQSYRDAWYVGFTGNYTAAVWLGNDDFHPTRNMTGGSLPAMTWQRLMEYAHKNIDLKPIPGIENPFVDKEIAAKADEAAKREAEKSAAEAIDRPAVLSSQTTRFLKEMSARFRAAPPIEPPAEPKTLSAL